MMLEWERLNPYEYLAHGEDGMYKICHVEGTGFGVTYETLIGGDNDLDAAKALAQQHADGSGTDDA